MVTGLNLAHSQLPYIIDVSHKVTATEIPAYSDTLGTWEKCHCNQIVTVTRGSLVTNQSFGTCQEVSL